MAKMPSFLAAVAAMFLATPALAEFNPNAFVKPPDITTTWSQVVPLYEAGTTLNHPIDASVSPPNHALTDLPDYPTSQTGRTVSTTEQCIASSTGCPEAKFRSHANYTKVLHDDPIRNYGQPGTSHCHTFFGNKNVNAYSTYQKVRTNNSSFAAGAELNATGYWHPCIVMTNPFGDGKDYIKKPDYAVIYYVAGWEDGPKFSRIPHGLRYVTGFDMDEPSKAWLQTYIDAANAQPGTAGRYRLTNPLTGNSRYDHSISCSTAGAQTKYFKNPDGTDPFNGECTAGSDIIISMEAASCWDGVHLWSPGGYRHIIPGIWDHVASRFVCPKNYYEMPALIARVVLSHGGPTDYMRWRLSSDDHAAMVAGRTVQSGESWHFDWLDGWDQTTKNTWQQYCVGVEGNQPHECNDSAISGTKKLITSQAAPNGRSPQLDLSQKNTSIPANMWRLPPSPHGPVTVHVHGN